ncbi:unnamed protein product [Coregonus sp. 'balchen']|nr:unnamed protein product [Coregonus sp. 'balchen']
MSSQVGNVAELLEIDICDGDICSEGESGVFINSDTGASLSDGFSAFQQWTRPGCRSTSGHNNTGSVSERPRDCSSDTSSSSPSLHPQNGLGSGTGDRVTLGDLQGEDVRAPRSSIVDCLLVELYDTYSSARLSVDSPDSSTEASSSELFCRSNTGSSFLQELQEKHTRRHQVNYLSQKAPEEVRCIIEEVHYRTGLQAARLIYISIYLYCFPAPEELRCIIGEVLYRTGLQSAKLIYISIYLYCFPAPEELRCIIEEVLYRTGLQSAKLIYISIYLYIYIVFQHQKTPEELRCIIEEVLYRTGLQAAKLIYISIYLYCFPAPEELRCIIEEVLYRTGLQSAKLLRQLKRRDRFNHKLQKKYDIITACLQAVSQKRTKKF